MLVLAVASMAVGAGVNLGVYSVLSRILFQSVVTAPAPERLVRIAPGISFPNYQDLQRANLPIDLAAMQMTRFTCDSCGDIRSLTGHVVSSNFFEIVGTGAILGRTFTDADDTHHAVVTYALWQRLGADPDLVGRTLRLNGRPFQVVGVLPKGFAASVVAAGSIYVPIGEHVAVALQNRRAAQFDLFGRLYEHVTRQQAMAALELAVRELQARFPDDNRNLEGALRASSMDPFGFLSEFPVGRLVLGASATIYALVGLVLIVACANVAGLLIFRTHECRYELAVRAALGATRRQLAQPILAESLVISCLGCSGAALLWSLSIWWLNSRVLPSAATEIVVLPSTLGLGYCLSLVVITTVACGVIPAWNIGRARLSLNLQRRSTGAACGGLRVQRALVIAQVAICCVLLSAGAVLVRNLLRLQAADPGFDVSHLAEIDIRVPPSRKPAEAVRLRDAVRALPGVTAISWGSPVGPPFTEPLQFAGSPDSNVRVDIRRVGPDFFKTVGVRLVAGRDFTIADLENAAMMPIVVNESFVRHLLGADIPAGLGRTFVRPPDTETGRAPQKLVVVGVSSDCLARTIGDPHVPVAFVPIRQPSLTVRTATPPGPLARLLEETIERLEPPGTSVTATVMSESLRSALAPLRIAAAVLTGVGLLGCVLAMSGLFGVVTRAAAQRSFEIAVRLALGASRRSILGLVLSEAFQTIAIGSAAGIGCVLLFARVAQSLLTSQSLVDPIAFGLAVVALFVIGIGASLAPALCVSRIDPGVALRSD